MSLRWMSRHRSALGAIFLLSLIAGFARPARASAGDACKADLNHDGVVNFSDLAIMKGVFFQSCDKPAPVCGDDIAEAPEHCDDGNLMNGDGCSSTCQIEVPQGSGFGLLATGQISCWNTEGSVVPCAGSGQDGEFQEGAPLAYLDNGDGTITDVNTGLTWEKLDDDNVGGIHDNDDVYTWANSFGKIAQLNNQAFANHSDWRMPNLRELTSITNFQTGASAAVSTVFDTICSPGCTVQSCSCTRADAYWSSSTMQFDTRNAWSASFTFGSVFYVDKFSAFGVRAVRGGP